MKIEENCLYKYVSDCVVEENGKRKPGRHFCAYLTFTDEELEIMKPVTSRHMTLQDGLDKAHLADKLFKEILAHVNRRV